jgi:hypothetical protein
MWVPLDFVLNQFSSVHLFATVSPRAIFISSHLYLHLPCILFQWGFSIPPPLVICRLTPPCNLYWVKTFTAILHRSNICRHLCCFFFNILIEVELQLLKNMCIFLAIAGIVFCQLYQGAVICSSTKWWTCGIYGINLTSAAITWVYFYCWYNWTWYCKC